ncbi:MAG: DUF4064 domain-containing protein [Paenisporosarcina sp.]
MSRTGEVALGIIGTILNFLLLIIVAIAVFSASAVDSAEFQQMMEQEIMADPNMTQEDMEYVNDMIAVVMDVMGVVGWVVVGLLLLSVVLSIIAVVQVSKNKSPKTAGILFIFAGLLSGILLLAPILFYIAAIMCFVRKTPVHYVEDPYYRTEAVTQTETPQQPL